MKKLVLLIIVAALLIAKSLAQGSSAPSSDILITEARWVPFMVSNSGLSLWSYKNFQAVSSYDKFTFELRTEFLGSEIGVVESTIVASCEHLTAQITNDKIFSTTGQLIDQDRLTEKEPTAVDANSVIGTVLGAVCKPGIKI